MILVDYSSVMHSMVHTQINNFDDNVDLIRHLIINKLRDFNNTYKAEFGEMVLCFDAGGNWRKDKYPFYKAGRKKSRDDSKHDWGKIFGVLNEVQDDIINFMPYRTVGVKGAEADDIIGTICEMSNSPEPILIISPDKDFVQLQRYPNVKQYSNLQRKWVTPDEDALTDLNVKILRGDAGDGVPNVLSEDETLITEGKRQTPLSKKKLAALTENPESLGTTVARRIIRNKELIDLSQTPFEYKMKIMTEYEKPALGNVTKLMSLLTKYRMNQLLGSLSDFEVVKLNG